jgi:3-hydroxybutyryl-CoA dehydrogenase
MTLFDNIAVIGFGTMGGGIAQVIAQSGRSVTVLESEQARLDAGRAAIEAFLEDGVSRGKVTAEDRDATLGRIRTTTDVNDLAEVDLVVEAVTENLQVKSSVLRTVAETVRADAVITTNTSAISVSELATSVDRPGRFAGLHFFNPAQLMKVVEIVRGVATEPSVAERLEQFVEKIGKVPVVAKDRPGFLINKLFMPYINDVIQAFDDELASAEDIDTAIKLGLGYKMGPLELVDLIGLDVHEHATRSAYEATLDPVYAPPPLLQAMVAAGMKGTKNGKGFRTEDQK